MNLNKIQRSNERVSQDKDGLERHNDSLQNKTSASPLGCLNVNRAGKNVLVDKS